jgi:2-haloacid dehalogenase
MPLLDPAPKIITFDCYGTLVQWHAAMRDAAAAILATPPGAAAVIALADRIRSAAAERQARPPFIEYKPVLRESLGTALAEIGRAATPGDHDTLLRILARIEPHPDTRPALERLRARYRLAIISNTDDDLIAGTVAAIGVPIDRVITAQQARAYKPDHQLFRHAHATLGVAKEDTVHVAMGQVTDLKVCHELGIRCIWIDRAGEPLDPAWPPGATLPGLSALPSLLGA